jgi:hypothetical protein
VVADATPSTGVTKVGDVANTSEPEPVSSVTAEAKFADDGVPRNVATPVPRPLTPVEIGKPVHELNVPELGVPKTGVTSVGDVFKTTLPVPVLDVTPVPPLATTSVPATDTTPVVAVLGVKPVLPNEIESTLVNEALLAMV